MIGIEILESFVSRFLMLNVDSRFESTSSFFLICGQFRVFRVPHFLSSKFLKIIPKI